MSDSTITKTVFLAAPRETVWSYLTEKDKLGEWFHPSEADLVEGQDYALLDNDESGAQFRICWGTVIRMEPPSDLVYSFTFAPLNGAATTVSWLLEETTGGTKLTLTHEGVREAAGDAAFGMLKALDAGWDTHFAKLREKIGA